MTHVEFWYAILLKKKSIHESPPPLVPLKKQFDNSKIRKQSFVLRDKKGENLNERVDQNLDDKKYRYSVKLILHATLRKRNTGKKRKNVFFSS